MHNRIWVAALIACAVGGAQAAVLPESGRLFGPGQYNVTLPAVPGTNVFSESLAFTGVAQDSVLTARLFGITSGASTLTGTRFNLSTGATDTFQVSRQIVTDGLLFDLGALKASEIGFSPKGYVLQLSGTLAPEALGTGVSLQLFVRPPIPEPGTWALMGLGLVGLFAVGRQRAGADTQ